MITFCTILSPLSAEFEQSLMFSPPSFCSFTSCCPIPQLLPPPTTISLPSLLSRLGQWGGTRDVGVPQLAPHSLPAPWGRGREWWGWPSLSAAPGLEYRRGGANEGGDGPGDSGGSFPGQLIVLLGAGYQVCAHHVLATLTSCFALLSIQKRKKKNPRSPKSVAKHDNHTALFFRMCY